MSLYKPLAIKIWSDPDFEKYSIQKKLLFIFFITNPLSEKSGIYKITIKQISFYTDIEKDCINGFINEFINEGKMKYDFNNEVIFIKNVFKFQKGVIKNKNIMMSSLLKNYQDVKTNLWEEFFNYYSSDEVINEFINEVINKGLTTKDLSKKLRKNYKPPKAPKPIKEEERGQFEEFWQAYTPIKTKDGIVAKGSKKEAEKQFLKIIAKEDFNQIMDGLNKYLAYCQKNQRFTKQVKVWLNKEGWKDDFGDAVILTNKEITSEEYNNQVLANIKF